MSIINRDDEQFFVQKIRTQYIEKEDTRLDALKKLDAKVKRPANVFAYTFGSVGAIVMGSGMSLVMTDIGGVLGMQDTMALGIFIGVIGLLMAVCNYPIYKRMLQARRKKYAADVLTLSERIMKQN